VIDHMLKRAGEQPEAFSALIHVRLADVLWMIRDSKKTGEKGCDPDLYRAALRYTAALFSTTNAFKYVRISADLSIALPNMETAVWDAFIFTQQTVNGKRIWSDREVEWLMKDIRSWLLKHARPNHKRRC
jgi:hypothetical protein